MAFGRGKKKAKAVEETKVEETKVETTEEELVEGIGSAEEIAEGIQTTFNTDGLDILVAEGEVENVEVYDKD